MKYKVRLREEGESKCKGIKSWETAQTTSQELINDEDVLIESQKELLNRLPKNKEAGKTEQKDLKEIDKVNYNGIQNDIIERRREEVEAKCVDIKSVEMEQMNLQQLINDKDVLILRTRVDCIPIHMIPYLSYTI